MTTMWRGRMSQADNGLWVRQQSDLLAVEVKAQRFRRGLLWGGRKRTIRDNTGRAMGQIKVSDSGNSEHEYKDRQDAVVRPAPVSITATAAKDGIEEGDLIRRLEQTTRTLPVAEAEYKAARLAVSQLPSDALVQARWVKAKQDLFESRRLWRLQGRRSNN